MSISTIRLTIPMTMRKVAETVVPIRPPMSWKTGIELTMLAEIAMTTVSATTIVEWPSEKKNPTPTGRCPSCISFRVVLSMAAMWSASTACRSPSV